MVFLAEAMAPERQIRSLSSEETETHDRCETRIDLDDLLRRRSGAARFRKPARATLTRTFRLLKRPSIKAAVSS